MATEAPKSSSLDGRGHGAVTASLQHEELPRETQWFTPPAQGKWGSQERVSQNRAVSPVADHLGVPGNNGRLEGPRKNLYAGVYRQSSRSRACSTPTSRVPRSSDLPAGDGRTHTGCQLRTGEGRGLSI